MELLLVHDSRQPKVGDKQICVVLGCSEEQVLRLQVAMDDTMVVEIGDCGERGSNEVGGIGFVVGAFTAYAIEELAAQREICDEVYCCEVS